MTSLTQVDECFHKAQQSALGPKYPGKSVEVQNCKRHLQNEIGDCGELHLRDRQKLGPHALRHVDDFDDNTLPGPVISIYKLMQDLGISKL